MLRRTFGKTLTLVIAICLLSAGIAPANPSCTADCCVQPNSPASHTEAETTSADLVSSCCVGIETAPCPHMLESATEIKDYAISAVSAEVNPATAKLAVAASDIFFMPQPHHYVAALMRPPIRGPSVPLFLQNLSLLI